MNGVRVFGFTSLESDRPFGTDPPGGPRECMENEPGKDVAEALSLARAFAFHSPDRPEDRSLPCKSFTQIELRVFLCELRASAFH